MNFSLVLSVALGGATGALFRFFISMWVNRALGSYFAYGTLAVNIIGSLIIGFLYLYFEQVISPNLKALLITGMLGALTTFSTFSLETLLMIEQGSFYKAALNILLNVTLTLSATYLGMVLFKKVYGI